jgi:phenylalanyl-tRNA synthetase beta chain
MGLSEVWTDSFGSASELDDLGLGQDHPARDMVEIANPSSDLDSSLRTTLIPRLLRAAAHNFARRAKGVGLFEIARIYLARSHPLPDEALMIGFVFAGERVPTSWTAGQQGWDFFAAKGVLEALSRSLGAPVLRARPITKMPFHPTRAAGLTIDDVDIGVLGELHPRVCESYSVPEATVVAEISATRLFEAAADVVQAVEPSRYPAVYLDLAFVVSDAIAAEVLWDAIAIAGAPELSSMRLFDLYEGPQVGEGNKSLAFALELRAPDRTLTDEEAEAVRHRIVTAAADRVGAVLRT